MLLARDVEEELQDQHAVVRKVAFERCNVVEAPIPDLAIDELGRKVLCAQVFRMHADDQHLFVIRTVENADPPALGQAARRAPQEVVIELLGRGLLERVDLAALRIEAGGHVLDRPVLSRGIHRLEHEQH